MPRFKRSLAVLAAVVAAGAMAAAPASAQDIDLGDISWNADNPCASTQPNLPECVDWSIATAIWAVETGRWGYNEGVQPILDDAACFVYKTATGEDECPQDMVPKL